jgi:hypothetical protein
MTTRPAFRAAWLTAACLVGGLIVGVGLGLVLSPFPDRRPVQYVLSGAVALAVIAAAGAIWGRAIGRLAGSADPRRMAWAGALGTGPIIVLTGVGLGLLEPIVVGRVAARGLAVHVGFTMMFVPAAFLVAAVGAGAVGVAMRDWALGRRLAIGAGLAAAVAFLAVDLFMDTIGWRVGAPGAAERATMLTVTGLGSVAAALVAGAWIGKVLAGQGSSLAGE